MKDGLNERPIRKILQIFDPSSKYPSMNFAYLDTIIYNNNIQLQYI